MIDRLALIAALVIVGFVALVGPSHSKENYPPPYTDKNGVVIYPDPNFPDKRDPTPVQKYRNELPPVEIINNNRPPKTLYQKRIEAIRAPENRPGISGYINGDIELVGGRRWRGGPGWGYGPGYYPRGRYDVWRGGPWPGGDYDFVPPQRYEPNYRGRYLVPGGGYSYYSESVPYPRYVYPGPGYGPPPVYYERPRRRLRGGVEFGPGGIRGQIGGFGFGFRF